MPPCGVARSYCSISASAGQVAERSREKSRPAFDDIPGRQRMLLLEHQHAVPQAGASMGLRRGAVLVEHRREVRARHCDGMSAST
jgi:hypothetical protein